MLTSNYSLSHLPFILWSSNVTCELELELVPSLGNALSNGDSSILLLRVDPRELNSASLLRKLVSIRRVVSNSPTAKLKWSPSNIATTSPMVGLQSCECCKHKSAMLMTRCTSDSSLMSKHIVLSIRSMIFSSLCNLHAYTHNHILINCVEIYQIHHEMQVQLYNIPIENKNQL